MEIIRKIIYSLGGRKFLLALATPYIIDPLIKAGVEPGLIFAGVAAVVSFILGESFKDCLVAAKKPDESVNTESIAKQPSPNESTTQVKGLNKIGFHMRNLGLLAFVISAPFILGGCLGSNPQAGRAVASMEIAAVNYSHNMEQIVNAFIADYRDQALAKIDRDHEAAIKSVIKPDGSINVLTAKGLMDKKLRDYAAVQQKVLEMRKKLITANKDIEHLLQYSKALKQYFDQKAQAMQIVEQSTDEMMILLEKLTQNGKPNK